MTWVTDGAGGTCSSSTDVATPVQVLSKTENFVTQWKSACTSLRGSSPKPAQSHERVSPSAVAPQTVKSQAASSKAGTRP